MTQRFSFWEDLTIAENLDFVARIYGVRNRRRPSHESLERLGLDQRRNQLAGQLSGGWKQRLALAACLIHQPKLLLLDEPTAGVDPKARRDFWEEIHQLAGQGLTFLIATHYMDEAERCHRLAYILYGKLLAFGTAAEVIAQAHLTTWSVTGPRSAGSCRETSRPAAACSRRWCSARPCTSAATTTRRPGTGHRRLSHAGVPVAAHLQSGLEDVFIHLMDEAQAEDATMNEFSGSSLMRLWAVVVKEFVQMRRDRLTFGMMVGIPLMQLVLFGFAINADPRHLPAGVVLADNGPFGRTLLEAMRNSSYFDFVRLMKTEEEADLALVRGEVLFVVNIPENFSRDLVRGDRPVLLVEADATDPAATSNAIGSLIGDAGHSPAK